MTVQEFKAILNFLGLNFFYTIATNTQVLLTW